MIVNKQPSDPLQKEEVHLVYKGWDSIKLIGRVLDRFKELIEKGWDWRSFYNGWLEGRPDMLCELHDEYDKGLMELRAKLFAKEKELAEANQKIRELQIWINSHI